MSGHVKNILKRQKTKWDEHSALTNYEIENEILNFKRLSRTFVY